MSDWAIAFDYNNRCLWLDDETLQFRDLGYDVTFTTLEDNKGMTFLLIYRMNLNVEDYGLEMPPHLRESEIKLRNIISEAVRHALRQVLNEKTLSEHRPIRIRRPNRVRNL